MGQALLSKFSSQVATENQHAFIVGATTERGFPLDVDYPVVSREGLGSNPGWAAEADIT